MMLLVTLLWPVGTFRRTVRNPFLAFCVSTNHEVSSFSVKARLVYVRVQRLFVKSHGLVLYLKTKLF